MKKQLASSSSPPSSMPTTPLDTRTPSSLSVPTTSSPGSSPVSTPITTSAQHGFRSQLGNLIPKHALFQVHLHIDQLSNVPLVKGEFGVRWKFKNVQSGSSLLSKMKGAGSTPGASSSSVSGGLKSATSSSFNLSLHSKKSDSARGRQSNSSTTASSSAKGKARAHEIGLGIGVGPHIEVTFHDDTNDRLSGYQVPFFNGGDEDQEQEQEELDPEIIDDAPRTSYESEDLPTATHSTWRRPRHSDDSTGPYGRYLTSSPPLDTPTPLPPPVSAAPTVTKASFAQHPHLSSVAQSEARGMTDWAKLQSYNVQWQHKLNLVVQMDVHRETNDLLPNELKLVVMQRVVQGDPDAPHQPRLGAVYLNLAEYAGAGPVTRRYLLRESKTNATLKLTIELEHIGGTKNFIPPPLKKGEILAEVSGLLSNNDLLRTRLARNLDLYTRSGSATPLASLAFNSPLESSLSLAHRASKKDLSHSHLYSHDQENTPWTKENGQVDFHTLANVTGLHTTENLIESLFNPIPIDSKEISSPFTVYDPEQARARFLKLREQDGVLGGNVDMMRSASGRSTSLSHSTMSSSISTSTSAGSDGSGSGSGGAGMADIEDGLDRDSESEESHFTRSSSHGHGRSSRSRGGKARSHASHASNASNGSGSSGSGGHAGNVSNASGKEKEKGGWWRKIRSRPGTPVSGRFQGGPAVPALEA